MNAFTLKLFGCVLCILVVDTKITAQSQRRYFGALALNINQVQLYRPNVSEEFKGLAAASYLLKAGYVLYSDSVHTINIALRYATERSQFERQLAPENFVYYRLANHCLTFELEGLLRLSNKIFVSGGLNLVHIYRSSIQGNEVKSNGYAYYRVVDGNEHVWDIRPSIGYQICLSSGNKTRLFFSLEPSIKQRVAGLQNTTLSAQNPTPYFSVHYSGILLIAGIRL